MYLEKSVPYMKKTRVTTAKRSVPWYDLGIARVLSSVGDVKEMGDYESLRK